MVHIHVEIETERSVSTRRMEVKHELHIPKTIEFSLCPFESPWPRRLESKSTRSNLMKAAIRMFKMRTTVWRKHNQYRGHFPMIFGRLICPQKS